MNWIEPSEIPGAKIRDNPVLAKLSVPARPYAVVYYNTLGVGWTDWDSGNPIEILGWQPIRD